MAMTIDEAMEHVGGHVRVRTCTEGWPSYVGQEGKLVLAPGGEWVDVILDGDSDYTCFNVSELSKL